MKPNKYSANGLVHCAAAASACIYAVLAWWPNNIGSLPLSLFYCLIGFAALLLASVFWLSRSRILSPWIVLIWAFVFRVIGMCGVPIYEDDYYRYLWDAYQFVNLGTPYGIAPAEYFGDQNIPLHFQRILDGINYPDIATIYGPSLQYLFLVAYWIAPGEVWALQLLLSLADMALIILLLKIAASRWVLLYAWAPLAIKEIAFTAHPDGFGALLLVAAVISQTKGLYKSCVFFLAASIAAKVFALIAAPFILIRLPWSYRFCCAGLVFLLYLPFLIQGGSDMAGLLVFVNEWQFNSSLYLLMRQIFTQGTSKVLLAAVFLTVYGFYFYSYYYQNAFEQKDKSTNNNSQSIPRFDLIFGGFFLIAPVVNAWYLLWLLPFAVIHPSRWAWVFSLSVLLSYTTGLTWDSNSLAAFQIPLWVLIAEYGAVLLAGIWDIYKAKRGYADKNNSKLAAV